MPEKTAAIIGAGPAGLTAAYELLNRTDIKPIVFEKSSDIGGISKTVNYKGNRIDIGGHRFFSKSDTIMDWWLNIFPLQGQEAKDDLLLKRTVRLSTRQGAPDPEKNDRVMLIRSRLSRIFFNRVFFDYPISLKWSTFKNLGWSTMMAIGLGYLKVRVRPIRREKSLEDFLINRFGDTLYKIFFKDYTEKVWGVSCRDISPDWGAQRIKGLSITKTALNAVGRIFRKDSTDYKNVETTLVEHFYYPKYGPGQLWEEVAQRVADQGGQIRLNSEVIGLTLGAGGVETVEVRDAKTGEMTALKPDYVISTMPVKDLIRSLQPQAPPRVAETAAGLVYRDFITVGLLLKKMKLKNESKLPALNGLVPDNWIYIQERDVRIGRLQIFNNWSPYLVKDPDTVWLGLEYFCNEGDELWSMEDAAFIDFAVRELEKIDLIDSHDVLDATVLRVEKTYPAYFGTYGDFQVIREFTDGIPNLFLIGRNGMHRYNNADHSMLTAITAVENIINGVTAKDNIWAVNTEEDYHEE